MSIVTSRGQPFVSITLLVKQPLDNPGALLTFFSIMRRGDVSTLCLVYWIFVAIYIWMGAAICRTLDSIEPISFVGLIFIVLIFQVTLAQYLACNPIIAFVNIYLQHNISIKHKAHQHVIKHSLPSLEFCINNFKVSSLSFLNQL